MEIKILESSTQHLKDFKLAIEFKSLTRNSPAGVYVIPELDSIRNLHGVVFVRRGLYREGVFRFQISLPLEYNDVGTHPEVFFTPPVYNPLINPMTGRLDLKQDESMKEWHPDRHSILTAITFIKKIFYMNSYSEFPVVANEEARSL
jgi:ubiquitin-protein ligase